MAEEVVGKAAKNILGVFTSPPVLYTAFFFAAGAALYFGVKEVKDYLDKLFGNGSAIGDALDTAATNYGYATSQGQNDPLLQYNQARVAYAKAQGIPAGTADYRNPPGFPSYQVWQTESGLGI